MGWPNFDTEMNFGDVGLRMGSVRAQLSHHLLKVLARGQAVPEHDAIQLRNWAVRPEDTMLSLEEIARRIIDQEEKPNVKAAQQG
jgi:hypothetical protein